MGDSDMYVTWWYWAKNFEFFTLDKICKTVFDRGSLGGRYFWVAQKEKLLINALVHCL
jgi:hypothetical protein